MKMILNCYAIYHNLKKVNKEPTYQEFKIYLILALLCLFIDLFVLKIANFSKYIYLKMSLRKLQTS